MGKFNRKISKITEKRMEKLYIPLLTNRLKIYSFVIPDSECSAQLSLFLAGVSVGAIVRSVHGDDGTVVLHCDINK